MENFPGIQDVLERNMTIGVLLAGLAQTIATLESLGVARDIAVNRAGEMHGINIPVDAVENPGRDDSPVATMPRRAA